LIGRAPESDLVLTLGGVSRKHARFFLKDGAPWVEDLGSSNGTFLNGARIEGPTPVPAGATLQLGDYKLSVSGAPELPWPAELRPLPAESSDGLDGETPNDLFPAGAAPRPTDRSPALRRPSALGKPPPRDALAVRPRASAVARPSQTLQASRWVLKGVSGLYVGQSYPISGCMLVGRVPPAVILVDDTSVSRRHAELELRGDQVVVRDLGSANGTHINGERVTDETPLASGDMVEFGVIEFSLERLDADALAPVDGMGLAASGRRVPVRRKGKEGGKRSLVFVLAVTAMVAMIGAVLAKTLGLLDRSHTLSAAEQRLEMKHSQVEELLAQCRTSSEGQFGGEPNWEAAEAACTKAEDLDPGNTSAAELLKHIVFEKESAAHFKAAEKNLVLFQAAEAIDEYAKIPEQSVYYLKAKPRVLEAMEQVRRKSEEDCKRYLKDNLLEAAIPRCEEFMKYSCQNMTQEELRPPMGYRMNLGTGKLKRGEWRPKEGLYLSFLRARQKLKATVAPWSCPELAIGKKTVAAQKPELFVRRAVDGLFPEKPLADALFAYWRGHAEESVAVLSKFRSDNRNARLHPVSDDLQRKIASAQNLFQRAEGELHQRDLEKASDDFQIVLQQDSLLLKDEAEKHPSFFRRSIQDDMARAAYQVGTDKRQHQDMGKACAIFKLGLSYSKRDGDLLNAINECSGIASQKLEAAHSCDDLSDALRYASDNDGVKEKVEKAKVDHHCP
jgi:pSer/pThr/pTyr-binding forkhead associated (FHA) protein